MVDYNVTGTRRKALVKALEALVGERAIYQGTPSMAFRVGTFTVSKAGEITGGELSEEIKNRLAEVGFVPVDEGEEESTGIVISVSRDELSDSTIQNFENMVSSKGELIKRAFGLTDLPINKTDDTLQILWFKDKEPGNTEMAETFVKAMLEKAVQQKYVSPKPLETDNPKYSFRVFLNSLGFKGPEHKVLRNDLLSNLPGSTAWRHGKPSLSEAEERSEAS